MSGGAMMAAHRMNGSFAQVMNIGTYDDIRRLERAFDADTAFRAMFGGEPATVLRALGWFGDVPSLAEADPTVLLAARDAVGDLPEVEIQHGSLAGSSGKRNANR
jgi:hypothetical protein